MAVSICVGILGQDDGCGTRQAGLGDRHSNIQLSLYFGDLQILISLITSVTW
jgi:hypothetical protein